MEDGGNRRATLHVNNKASASYEQYYIILLYNLDNLTYIRNHVDYDAREISALNN